VKRARALGELRDCLGKALRGERQIVFITDEPGIGKTALADGFLCQASAEVPGLRIAHGQRIEGYGGKEAYYPMLEALRELCGVPAETQSSKPIRRKRGTANWWVRGAGSRFASSYRKRPACRLRHERRLSPSIQNHQ